MSESRVRFLEQSLAQLGMNNALNAFDLMKEEMCAEKGFARHNGSHYYYHLVDVTQDLLNYGIRNEDCIVASLLHDYLEDVEGVTFKLIEQKFGHTPATWVRILSKTPGIDYKVKENIENYLHVIGLDQFIALIKASDRKHNFSTLREASFEKRLRQAIETETYFIPFFKKMRIKYPRYASYFYGAKTAIEPHLWAIKDYQYEIDMLGHTIHNLSSENEEYKFILEGLRNNE